MKTMKSLVSRVALAGLLLAATPSAAEPYELSDCPEVIVVLEDPVEPDGSVGPKVAEIACEKLKELAPKFGLELTGKPMVRLMIADDPKTFHQHTGKGIFTQAIYSQRTGIITQPAKQIRRMHRRKSLGGLLAHELTHYLVGEIAGRRCPLWLNEGLAQWFEKRPIRPGGPTTELQLKKLEMTWRSNAPPRVRVWCYRQSLALTARLIEAVSEKSLLAALPALADLRDPLALPIQGKTMRAWLFPDAADEPPDSGDDQRQVEIIRGTDQPKVTPLPLKEMLDKAKSKKK